jgi:crotonobetainyl-CoA:carnitine CoA-transferase CaiB-like acyl-CoA transferase
MAIWHPFLTGRLARWRKVEQWLEEILNRGDVWFAPLHEIAAYVRNKHQSENSIRVEHLPYYNKPVSL